MVKARHQGCLSYGWVTFAVALMVWLSDSVIALVDPRAGVILAKFPSFFGDLGHNRYQEDRSPGKKIFFVLQSEKWWYLDSRSLTVCLKPANQDSQKGYVLWRSPQLVTVGANAITSLWRGIPRLQCDRAIAKRPKNNCQRFADQVYPIARCCRKLWFFGIKLRVWLHILIHWFIDTLWVSSYNQTNYWSNKLLVWLASFSDRYLTLRN